MSGGGHGVDAGAVFFSHVAQKEDDEIDLAAAALLIAEPEYGSIDVAHYVAMLDGMADAVKKRLVPDAGGADAIVAALNHYLFEELGFRGNDEDYYDPKNSFLNEVLDRRVGIPITLSIVYLELGWRMGLPLVGVSFPGHFLVRFDDAAEDRLLDPYHSGVALGPHELKDRLQQAMGGTAELSPEHLQPANKRQVLTRMLNNLRGIYQRLGDGRRELSALEKLAALNPRDDRLADAVAELRKRVAGGAPGPGPN